MAEQHKTAGLKEYRTIDKSAWSPGPWQDEPDKIQWINEATGFPCLIVRAPLHGALCGYVGVPDSHRFFEKIYEYIEENTTISVHGGLTFADHCQKGPDVETHGICHIPEPGQPDNVWWIGFDCAHAGDYNPAYEHRFKALGLGIYRNISYVRNQVTQLAAQLI